MIERVGRVRAGVRAVLCCAACAFVIAVGLGLAGCGSTAPAPSGRLVLDGIGPITGCTGYGHSGIVGFGVLPSQAFVTKVCDRFAGTVLNLGVGGSTLQGQLVALLPRIPADAATQLSVVMWGANDLALFGPSLAGYEAGLRELVSRLRTRPSDVHGFSDPALHYVGHWTNAVGEKVTRENGEFVWRSPRGFRGGVVAFTVMFRQGIGAVYTFSRDGKRVGTLDTRTLGTPRPAPAANTPAAFRVRVPAGGGHIVRGSITSVLGGANLVGFSLESRRPGLVVLVEHPRPPSFTIYRHGPWPFMPTDAEIEALDRAMSAVAHEFDGYVVTVDPDAAFGRSKRDFLADQFHFSVAGNRIVATMIERAIARDPHVRSAPS